MHDNARTHRRFAHLAWLAAALGVVVVMLGAYARLKDAGLGCPDWPGCYGQLLGVPHTPGELKQAAQHFPKVPVVEAKAWPEVIHRYAAGCLGLLIAGLSVANLVWRSRAKVPGAALSMVLLGLLTFQAVLGMWTVTMLLLPLVVMSHLLGGMTLTCLLWALGWRHAAAARSTQPLTDVVYRAGSALKRWVHPGWLVAGTVVITLQIAMGGWTSTHYASLICPDFPFCRGSLFPSMDVHAGFKLLSPLGVNYQGGVLNEAARIAIQMFHRYGAALVLLFMVVSVGVMERQRRLPSRALACLRASMVLLVLQVVLGVVNVVHQLPMWAAVAHNGVALLYVMAWLSVGLVAASALTPSSHQA